VHEEMKAVETAYILGITGLEKVNPAAASVICHIITE